MTTGKTTDTSLSLIEKLEALKSEAIAIETHVSHNEAIDRCITILRQYLSDPAVVEEIANQIHITAFGDDLIKSPVCKMDRKFAKAALSVIGGGDGK